MGSTVGGIVGAAGSYFGGKRAADAARDAGVRQMQAADKAFEASRFKPVGITTRFGQSAFETDPSGGVTSATYTATPEVQRLQEQLSGMYGSSLGQAERAMAMQPQYEQAGQGLFNLGQSYLAESPDQARQRYMQQQMDVLRPYDIEEEQRLASSVFGRGRGGLSVGAGGQPELQALAESRNRRNLQLAAGADQAAQQQISFGQGLLGGSAQTTGLGYGLQQQALAPFQAQFGTAQGLDDAAKQSLQMGLGIGEASSLAGARAGELYANNMNRANASFREQGNIRGGMLSGMGQSFGNMLGGMSMPTGGGGSMPGIMGNTASGMPYQYGARGTGGGYST